MIKDLNYFSSTFRVSVLGSFLNSEIRALRHESTKPDINQPHISI